MARNLNNELRREVAIKLAIQAVKKNGAALGRLAEHLRKAQRDVYLTRLAAIEDGITPERWAELIQKRLVMGYRGREQLQVTIRGENESGQPTVQRKNIYHNTVEFSRSASDQRRHTIWNEFIGELRSVSGFSAALGIVGTYEITRERQTYLTATSLAQPDLPPIDKAEHLDPEVPLQAKLVNDTKAFLARLARVLTTGFNYLEECLDLLNGCRTDKQLLDLFPEAAKLLPPAPVVHKSVVPAEQAQKLRKLLETGVPED